MILQKRIKELADNRIPGSKANSFRNKRIKIFESFIIDNYGANKLAADEKIRIIDIGGTYNYWLNSGFSMMDNVEITLVNLEPTFVAEEAKNIVFAIGDATNLENFEDHSFDIAYSNSCIEHVGKDREWKMMANEMERVADHLFLQTPNKYFPIEPHFLFPLFQFFPLPVKAFLIRHFQLGFWPKGKNWADSKKIADEIKLLRRSDLKRLFPNAKIQDEKYMCMTKSFMVYK